MDKETLDDYNRCLKAVTKTGVSKILDVYTVICKNGYDLEFKEHKEEDETIIQKHLFNYLLINYLKKLKIEKDKNEKILTNILL